MSINYQFKYMPLIGKLPGKSMAQQTETAINEIAKIVNENVAQAEIINTLAQDANNNSVEALEKANEALQTTGRVYVNVEGVVNLDNYCQSELLWIRNASSTNLPIQHSGFLEVKTNSNKTHAEQIFIDDSSGIVYSRAGTITAQQVGDVTNYVASYGEWVTIATNTYVTAEITGRLSNYAPLASPAFTGTPTAPTPTATDNSAKVATTAFVNTKASNYLPLAGGTMTGAIVREGVAIAGAPSNSRFIGLCGGADSNSGSYLALRGKGNNYGSFDISANDGENKKILAGFADGRLTWDGQDIALQKDVLSLTGGTMTGAIVRDGIAIAGMPSNNRYVMFCGGSDVNSGASISLRGKGNNDGSFDISANDGKNRKILAGSADGKLTWDAQAIALQKDVLSLTGGTMTGAIVRDGIAIAGVSSNNRFVMFCGGSDVNSGASISLRGKGNNDGYFDIVAHNGTNRKVLAGFADGRLTWDAQAIALQKDVLSLTGGTMLGNLIVNRSGRDILFFSSRQGGLNRGINPSSQYGFHTLRTEDADGKPLNSLYTVVNTNGDSQLRQYVYKFTEDNINYSRQIIFNIDLDGNSNYYPGQDNVINLGVAGYRWKQLYAGTTTISTSDERLKDNIVAIPDAVLDAWGEVNWYQYQFKDSIAEKGETKARIHTGAIAQRIESVFKSHGLDANKYGLLCYDEWKAEPAERDEDGNIVQPARPAGNRYSLRYEEALCMEAAYQRRRADRLEQRLNDIEQRLSALEE